MSARWAYLAVFVGVSFAYLCFLKPVIAALLASIVLARYASTLPVLGVLVVIASVLGEMCRARIAPARRRFTA